MSAAIDGARPRAIDWGFIPAREHTRWTRSWDELNRRGCRSPLIQSWFLLPALEHLGTGDEVVAIGRRACNSVAAMMLLSPPSALHCKGFQPSQLPLATVLLAPGGNVADVARSLLHALPGRVLALTLLHLDERFLAMPAATADVDISPRFDTGSVFVGRDFADYQAAIPLLARQTFEQFLRKAEAEIGRASLQVWESTDRINEFLRLYSYTEARGWTGDTGSVAECDEAQGHFYSEVLQAAGERGALRMFLLMLGDRPAAQQIGIDFDGITYFLKATYDESLGSYAPDVILQHLILRWSASRKPPTRDFEIYGHLTETTAPLVTTKRQTYDLTVTRSRILKAPLGLVRWLTGRSSS